MSLVYQLSFDLQQLISSTFQQSSNSEVAARLLSYEDKRQAKIEEARKLQLEQEALKATFKPTIVLTKRSATPNRSNETIFERLSKQYLEKDHTAPVPVPTDTLVCIIIYIS